MRRAHVLAVWEFVVGEDWRTAIGVIVALGSTAALAGAGIPAWWVVPVAVIALLALSLRRATSGCSPDRCHLALVRPDIQKPQPGSERD